MGALPDDVLLEIFDIYLNGDIYWEWEWLTLAHVSRRWRNVVSASPCRLDLLLLCTEKTPVREMLDAWPTLPIKISHNLHSTSPIECADSIFAALEHRDRLCHISLQAGGGPGPQWETFAEATMQEPFPALTGLNLKWKDDTAPILPESFLDGSAPRLEWLSLKRVPFPSLPRLLLSASDLVNVSLSQIPHTGYISPERMATCLAAMTRLKSISLGFPSPRSRPDPASRQPPPSTRVVLPTLTSFSFFGVSEYLEDLVALIDAPLLHHVYVTFLHQLIFDIPQLARFIGFSEELGTLDQVDVSFYDSSIEVILYSSGKARQSQEARIENLMHEPGMATFSSGASLRLTLTHAPPPNFGTSPNPRG
jgi:hypothetical protein